MPNNILLHKSNIPRTFKKAIDKRIIDALSSCSISSRRTGKTLAKSENISVSRERRHRAASRDFSFLFSLFLQEKEYTKINNLDKIEQNIMPLSIHLGETDKNDHSENYKSNLPFFYSIFI